MSRGVTALRAVLIVGIFLITSGSALAVETSCPELARSVATTPAPPWGMSQRERHAETIRRARKQAEIVLLGDSLTHSWPRDLATQLAPGRRVLNLGVSGDRTQGVLWRLSQPEEASLRPEVVVLLIGTNNVRDRQPACAVVAGVKAILDRIDAAWGQPQVLLLQILPRGRDGQAFAAERAEIAEGLRTLVRERPIVRLLDPGPAFTAEPAAYREDLVHLTRRGYEILTAQVGQALR